MSEAEDLTFKQLVTKGLRQRAGELSEMGLAARAADDNEAETRLSNLAIAKNLEADLVGGSPNLTPEENAELQNLSARFDAWMDGGQTAPGGLTKPEYSKLDHLLKKAGSLEEKKDSRR